MDVKFNTNLDIPELKTRIEELEIVALQWSQNESKYKDMLSKSTSEVSVFLIFINTTKHKVWEMFKEAVKMGIENKEASTMKFE